MEPGANQTLLADKLLHLARRSGADAAEVFQSSGYSRPVFFEANRLKQLESSATEGIALRLWQNHRPGLAVAYGPVAPQALVDKALALSQLNPPEEIELRPGCRQPYPDVGQAVEAKTLVAWGQEIIDRIRAVYPEVICGVELECASETTRIVNSLGLDLGYSDTTLSGYVTTEWVRGDDLLGIGDGQTQRGQLTILPLVEQVLQRLQWAEKNVLPPQGHVPVLFTAKSADMLWVTLQAALSGKRVVERSSPWSDRLGDCVAPVNLSLSQAPDLGPFSCPFDDEGTPTAPLTFIDQGVLQLFYTDRRVGRQLGVESTGNGFRPALGSYPSPSLFNTVIKPGHQSLAQLIRSIPDGLLVDQVLGEGAGISGDFSVNVDLGYRIRNGEVVGRVKDTMVAGNVYAMLKQPLVLGNDADWNGACYGPSAIVQGLSVTGR